MRLGHLLIVASALLVLGAGCSSDEPEEASTDDSTTSTADTTDTPDGTGTPGGTDTTTESPTDADGFCALLGDDDIDLDPTTDEGLALMDEIREVAPAELQDPIAVIFGAFEQFEDLDEEDPDAFAEVMALMFDPEFIAAGEALEAYGVDECGFEAGFMDTNDDLGDMDDADDQGTDDDPTSLDALQEWMDDNYADAAWLDVVVSWGMVNGSVSLGGEFEPAEATEACEAVAEWMVEVDAIEDIAVTDYDGVSVVEGSDGVCAAV